MTHESSRPFDLSVLVRSLRRRAGLTQPELANRTGVSVRAVRDIEHGRVRRPRPASLDRLARGLGLTDSERADLHRAGQPTHLPATSGLRVGILGALTVTAGDLTLPAGPPVQRTLLGLLALRAGEFVSRDEIVDTLWGDEPPRTCHTQVQGAVGRLRTLFEPARRPRADGHLVRSAWGGYRLDLDEDALDARRFERLAADAIRTADRGDPRTARQWFDEALRLWRGPVLEDAPHRLRNHPVAVALARLRVDVALRHADAAMASDAHADAVGWLRRLAADEPLHEALHARLMVALANAGDRALALQVHTELRERLIEELGLEPADEVREAYTRIVRGADLADDPGGAVGDLVGERVRPAQLPADLARFVGRTALLDRLDGLVPGRDATAGVVALSGTAGVGKTALAVHWAHRIARYFPDGQLFVNLRGFASGGTPVSPTDALRGFLDALDVPAERVPTDLDGRSALFRSLLAGRRFLVLLDNARDADHVRPLLPGAPGCLAVVTSRNDLSGLVAAVGAEPVALDLLTRDEAVDLLAGRLGAQRVADEPAAVDEIIGRCARLPLALAIVAARAVTRVSSPSPASTTSATLDPTGALAALAAELSEVGHGLDPFTAGDSTTDVRAVFAASYHALPAPAARLFRLLGLHPGPDIGVPAAASLAGLPLAATRRLLADLARTHLVAEPRPSRFAFHDLLREYAAELVDTVDTAEDRQEARHRLFDHYGLTGDSGARILNRYRGGFVDLTPIAGVVRQEFVGHDEALAWFQAEHATLIATVHATAATGFTIHTGRLAAALTTFLDRRGHWSDWADTQRVALEAARAAGDRPAEAHAHRRLARAHTRLSHLDEVRSHLLQALDAFAGLGDDFWVANTHLDLAMLGEAQGRPDDALAHAEQALAILRDREDPESVANAFNSVGWYHAQLGHHREALVHCAQALDLLRGLGHLDGEAQAWDSMGFAHYHLGEHEQAITCFGNALRLFQRLGDRYYEARILEHLGDAHRAAGEAEAGLAALRRAVTILEELGHPTADEVRQKLSIS